MSKLKTRVASLSCVLLCLTRLPADALAADGAGVRGVSRAGGVFLPVSR